MSIDFGNLISRSFEIAWRYKTLWIFGLFTGAGVGSLNTDIGDLTEDLDVDWGGWGGGQNYDRFFNDLDVPEEFLPAVLGAVALWIIVMVIIFVVCYLIAQPAIIDGVNKITRGGDYRLGDSFSRGIDFFWRFLGITIINGVVVLGMILLVALLAIVLTPFSLLLTIPAAVILGFFLYHTFRLAEVAMVTRDCDIGTALSEGWALTLQNSLNCLIMSALLIGMLIGFTVIVTLAALFAFVPINLLVAVITGNIVAALLLAVFLGLPISMILGGYTGTFFNALYVQFYFRLVEPQPQPQVIEATGPDSL